MNLPDCNICGCLISNAAKHVEYHLSKGDTLTYIREDVCVYECNTEYGDTCDICMKNARWQVNECKACNEHVLSVPLYIDGLY